MTAGGWIATLAGAASVAVVFVDVLLTTMHPSRRGPLTVAARRATWALLGPSRGHGRSRRGTFAGPVALLVDLVVWTGGLWLGFALVYLPAVDDLAYAPSVPFGDRGFVDALYLSGAALTTVGFGDVVAASDELRIVTTVEAASGFGIISAAVAYVLSLNPMLRASRSAATIASDLRLDEVAGAAELVGGDGRARVAAVHAAVVAHDHAIRRFPVLVYFAARDRRTSPTTLVRAAAVLSLVLRCAVDPQRVAWAPVEGNALDAAVRRVLDAYGDAFGTRLPDRPAQPFDVDALRSAVRRHAPAIAGAGGGTGAGDCAACAGRAQCALDRLSAAYGDRERPLVEAA